MYKKKRQSKQKSFLRRKTTKQFCFKIKYNRKKMIKGREIFRFSQHKRRNFPSYFYDKKKEERN